MGEGVVTEYEDPGGESERRRRAAWMLGMLVVVAALLVGLMVLFLHSGGKPAPNGIKPLPTAPPSNSSSQSNAPPTGTSHPSATGTSQATTHSAVPVRHPTTHSVKVPPRVVHHRVSCPSAAPCIAHGDIGNAVVAINAYRVHHGERPVNGAVTHAAQTCAVTNGGRCPNGWAETQVPRPTGAAAVHQVAALTDLLGHGLRAVQVGWAYDPAAHQYYFAVIRKG